MTSSHVAVVGAGTIGIGWAALFLARGNDVRVFDPAPDAERRLRDAIADAWPALSKLGLDASASPSRLVMCASIEDAVAKATFVQESGPEDLDSKATLLEAIDRHAPRAVVVASSTSGLMPSALQDLCTTHPERVLIGHPFHPAQLVPLVEVVPGKESTPESVEAAVAFYRSLGKRPIVVKGEVPGHLTNRLQAALWREAYSLIERGIATVADIDTAISAGPGLRWALLGPLVGQHLSGGPGGMAYTLRHLGPPAQEWMDDLGTPRLTESLSNTLVAQVNDELNGIDEQALIAQRDELLVELIARKRQYPSLP